VLLVKGREGKGGRLDKSKDINKNEKKMEST
jgi:hypothetical protein